MNLSISKQFIFDLDLAYAPNPTRVDVEALVSDLYVVSKTLSRDCEFLETLTDHDYSELASLFETMKLTLIDKLDGGSDWYEHLPLNDPLRCRISLFGTLDLGLRETAHTRTLGWLMNPDEDHGFKEALLRVFLGKIFMEMPHEPQLHDVRIECELISGETRDRLDIFMRGKWTLPDDKIEEWMVIVEAKVEADEGEDQCERYENLLQERISFSDHHALVFLTPDQGRMPETKSKCGGPQWIPISFITLMSLFRTQLPKLDKKPGIEFLRLYMTGVLKDLYLLNCGNITTKDDIYRISEYLSSGFTGGK